MPFTFAHPAAVVHLGRRFPRIFNMTALVLGSMAPDYEYFIRANGYSRTHDSILFHLTGGLAIALLLAVLFHTLLRRPLIRHLPCRIGKKLSHLAEMPWRPDRRWWLSFFPSYALGMLSHLLLDGFTHGSGFAVRRIPFLSTLLLEYPLPIHVYSLLQHGGGLAGLMILATLLCGSGTPIVSPVPPAGKRLFWGTAAVTAAGLFRIFLTGNEYGLRGQPLLNLIVAGLTACLLGTTAACLFFRNR